MSKTVERSFRICRYECDPYGHLNNANYVVWISLDSGRPIRIPQDFLDAFVPNFS